MKRSLCLPLLAVLLWAALLLPVPACPFCSEERGPTLVGDYSQATMVLFGHMANPTPSVGGEGTTDFVIEQVIKSHDVIKDKKVIQLPRLINSTKNKFLLFCDVYKGAIDPYRGIEIQPKSDLVEYLTQAVKLKDSPAPQRLRFCFDYLNSPDYEVALDAYREFAKADYKEYRDIASKLPADKLADWLRDPMTPAFRHGLYSSLLGHCGTTEHAKLLRSMIEDPEKRKGSGIDGMLAGYIMIQPKEGWSFLLDTLEDTKQEFLLRYACLRTIRFLWEQRPDLVSQKELVGGLTVILAQPDMADFAIEDLRKYRRWEMTDSVLALFSQKSHEIPVVKRAILRFALQSPQAQALAFVRAQRQRDADWVRDTEELLKLEASVAP